MKQLLFPAIRLSIGLDFLDLLFYMGLVAMQAGVMVSFSEDDLEQFYLADLLTMVFNQLITATILQVDQVYTYRNAIRKPPEWWRTMAAMTWFSSRDISKQKIQKMIKANPQKWCDWKRILDPLLGPGVSFQQVGSNFKPRECVILGGDHCIRMEGKGFAKGTSRTRPKLIIWWSTRSQLTISKLYFPGWNCI